MTVFRILPNGARRRLPGGSVRALGANGSRYTDIAGRTAVGIGNAGRASALAGLIGQTLLSFQLQADADSAGVIGLARLSFFSSGQLSARLSVSGRVQFGIGTAGRLSAFAPATGVAVVTLSAVGRMSNVAGVGGRARVDIGTVGMLGVRQILRGRAPLSFSVAGVLSVSSAAVFREVWRDYYDKRAALVMAIDEANRRLARQANDKSDANAQAIVQTRAEVKRVDDRVTSEASRTTLLTGRVTNAETQQGAQGRAIDSLTTTQTAQGRTIDSHTQQLTSVQASVTDVNGKTTQLANANQVLEARVRVNEQGIADASVRWGVFLDVNGNISGIESGNDGKRSWFRVLTDTFELIATGSLGAEFRRRGDSTYYLRFYAQAVQLIIGINFGAQNNFLAWFGPNVGEQGCAKTNGTAWADSSGNAHFEGSLSAGVPTAAMQSNQLGGHATVETGPFTTFGRPKTVTSSLSYRNAFTTQYDLGGDGLLTAILILERSIGGGGWVELSRRPITGNKTFIGYEGGVGYTYSFNIDGSGTYTDNTPGNASTFDYRVRMEGVSGWPYARPEGGANPWGFQSLSVRSLEQ